MKALCLPLAALILSLSAPAAALPPSSGPPDHVEGADAPPGPRPRVNLPEENEERRLAGWTLVSGGALFLLASVASTFRVDKLKGRVDDLAGTPEADTERIQELLDEQDTFEGLQLVGLLGGAALTLGGVTLLIFDAKQSPTRNHITMTPWFGDDAAGVSIGGGF